MKFPKSNEPVLPSVKIQPAVQYEDRFTDLSGINTVIKINREMAPVPGPGHCSVCLSNMTIEADPLKKCPHCSTIVCDVCTVWRKKDREIKVKNKKLFHTDHNAHCPTCGWIIYDYLAYHFRKEIW